MSLNMEGEGLVSAILSGVLEVLPFLMVEGGFLMRGGWFVSVKFHLKFSL